MDLRYIIKTAEILNDCESADSCIDVISHAVNTNISDMGGLAEYYDTVITVFVMAVNKSLYLAPSVADAEPADHYDAVDNYVRNIRAKLDSFIDSLREKTGNKNHEMFCDYMQKLVKYVFHNFNNHLCPDKDCDFSVKESWGLWDREDGMRDEMLNLIRDNRFTDLNAFTEKYSIQIPYMYVLVNDFNNMLQSQSRFGKTDYSKKENRSSSKERGYMERLPGNIKNWLRHIRDDRLLKMMRLDGDVGLVDPYWEEKGSDELIYEAEKLDFSNLLPCISQEGMLGGHKQEDYSITDYINRRISVVPEFYVTVPLVPATLARFRNNDYMSFVLETFKQDITNESLVAELRQTNAFLEQARQDKHEIIRDFAHTYKNLSATQLYDIATILLKDDSTRDYGKKLLVEYETKQNLTKEVEMMQLKFEDRTDELYQKITDSLSNDRATAVTAVGALDIALRRCLVTLFHSISNLGEILRDSITNIPGFVISEAENSFDNNVICGDDVSCTSWVNNNLFPLKVVVSPEWERVLMQRESYAALMLISILAELIQNVLKYADLPHGADIIFEDADDILIIRFQNCFSKDTYCRRLKNSGAGLASKGSVLDTLNKAAGCDSSWKAVDTQSEGNRFTTIVKMRKNLFIKEEHSDE